MNVIFTGIVICATLLSLVACKNGFDDVTPTVSQTGPSLAQRIQPSNKDLKGEPWDFSGDWKGTCTWGGQDHGPVVIHIAQTASNLYFTFDLGSKFGLTAQYLISNNQLYSQGLLWGVIGANALRIKDETNKVDVTLKRLSDTELGIDFSTTNTSAQIFCNSFESILSK